MVSKILEIANVHELNKKQQKSVKGGAMLPSSDNCGCVFMRRNPDILKLSQYHATAFALTASIQLVV